MTEIKEAYTHVMIMGSRGYKKNYGGWETLVDNLIENWVGDNYKFYVSELTHNRKTKDIYMNDKVICPQVYIPKFGHATMVFFSIKALLNSIKIVKKDKLENVIFMVIGLRIGPVFYFLKKVLKKYNIKVVINPDGFEWKRQKWSIAVKKYFLLSERTMYLSSDAIICDSNVIKRHIDMKYDGKNLKTYYASYGAKVKEETCNRINLENFLDKHSVTINNYYLIVGRFVPENNYELIITEYIKSNIKKDLVIIANIQNNKFKKHLLKVTGYNNDERIKFVGTIYDKELLEDIRLNAFGYIHGHSAGGTNPSLLEAMATTNLILAYDIGFNKEVLRESGFYFGNTNLCSILNEMDSLKKHQLLDLGIQNKLRISSSYSWNIVANSYKQVFNDILNRNQ